MNMGTMGTISIIYLKNCYFKNNIVLVYIWV